MKKRIIAFLMVAVLVATVLTGCTKSSETSTISEDGKVVVEQNIKIQKDYYDPEIFGSENDFKPETIDGVEYMSAVISSSFSTISKYKTFLTSVSLGSTYFSSLDITTTDFWGKIYPEQSTTLNMSKEEQAMIELMDMSLDLIIKFPYKITKTNVEKTDDYTAKIDLISFPKSYNVYIVTENSTADWTKAEDIDKEIKKMTFSSIQPTIKSLKLKDKSTAVLKWEKLDSANGYYVYQKVGSASWSKGKKVTGTTYTAKSLKKGKTYSFRIRAFLKDGSKEILSKYSYSLKETTLDSGKKPTIKTKSAKKQVTVTVSTVKGSDGYELSYSTNSKKGFKTVKSSTKSITKKKLKAKTTYYVKARAYKNTSSGKVYSKYSSLKKIKTK